MGQAPVGMGYYSLLCASPPTGSRAVCASKAKPLGRAVKAARGFLTWGGWVSACGVGLCLWRVWATRCGPESVPESKKYRIKTGAETARP